MNRAILIISSLLLAACVSNVRSQLDSNRPPVAKETAIEFAKKELARRKLSLPKNVSTRVSETFVFAESRPDTPIFVVSFGVGNGDQRETLYEVSVNRSSGMIENVAIFRRALLRAARGASERERDSMSGA